MEFDYWGLKASYLSIVTVLYGCSKKKKKEVFLRKLQFLDAKSTWIIQVIINYYIT